MPQGHQLSIVVGLHLKQADFIKCRLLWNALIKGTPGTTSSFLIKYHAKVAYTFHIALLHIN